MTTDMMSFRDLVEKAPDADLLREMIGFAAERLMEPEVGAVTIQCVGCEVVPGNRTVTRPTRRPQARLRSEFSTALPRAQNARDSPATRPPPRDRASPAVGR